MEDPKCVCGTLLQIQQEIQSQHTQALRRIAKLEQVLTIAKDKLKIYRLVTSGEYKGGMEFTALINEIDKALTTDDDEEV